MEYSLEEKQKYLTSLCAASKKITQPKLNSKVSYMSKMGRVSYDHATLGEVLACLKPLKDHGIIFTQQEIFDNGMWFMFTEISHVDGYSKSYKTFLKNSINSEKEFAASITYSRRYALCSIFGLYGQKDLDALIESLDENKNSAPAQQKKYISKELQNLLLAEMKTNNEFKIKMENHLKSSNYASIEKIPHTRESYYAEKLLYRREKLHAKSS